MYDGWPDGVARFGMQRILGQNIWGMTFGYVDLSCIHTTLLPPTPTYTTV